MNSMVQSTSLHLRNTVLVRSNPTESSTQSLGQSLVISRLDNGNIPLCGLPTDLITKLQLVKNKAARLTRDRITPAHRKLHRLPLDWWIQFMVLLIVYKALHGLAPQDISVGPQDSWDHLKTCYKYRRPGAPISRSSIYHTCKENLEHDSDTCSTTWFVSFLKSHPKTHCFKIVGVCLYPLTTYLMFYYVSTTCQFVC